MAYKFRIYPEYQQTDFSEQIKYQIFEEVRLMNQLWNRLAEIRKITLDSLSIIYNQEVEMHAPDKKGEGNLPISSKDLKRISPNYKLRSESLWNDYELQIKTVSSDIGIRETINWEIREDVLTRFEASHKKALKSGGEIKLFSSFIKQFRFPHRFTGGGLDATAIHKTRSKKLYVEKVADEFFEDESYRNRLNRVVSGRFGTGIHDALQISFRIVMHRQIPKEAKIKTAYFTGKLKNRFWEYYLVLTVIEPLQVTDNIIAERVIAGLDLGWRKFKSYIRFGLLVDTSGNSFELRLPFDPGKKQSQRRLEKLLAKHGKELPEYPQTWQDIDTWQSRNDIALGRVKEQLRMLDLPNTELITMTLNNLLKVKKSGLLRLLKHLEDYNADPETNNNPAVREATAILTVWRDEHFSRENAINYCRDRFLKNRNYIYQNLAKWLKINYAEIAYKGDLLLKKMAETATNPISLEEGGARVKNAAKYRDRVGLYELLRWIKQKENGGDNWLHPKKNVFKSRLCLRCGAECQKTANLIIVCPSGHEQDQDVQAATNLRNSLDGRIQKQSTPIIIPDNLKRIIVPMEIQV